MTTYLYAGGVLDESSPLDKEAMSNDTCDNSGIYCHLYFSFYFFDCRWR